MAITGAWKNNRVHDADYTGALRWGTGVNPVHALRDPGHKPHASREPLRQPQTDNYVPENILGPSQWGYSNEDPFVGEEYRYLRDDHPTWGQDSAGRADRDGQIMEVGKYPQPEGWPSWGPHDQLDEDFPLSGSLGGREVRKYSDGLDAERRHAIAVPTPGVSGMWENKIRGEQLEARTSDAKQYEINTSMVQAHQSMTNTRATGRGTDYLRTPIHARTAGMKEKHYPKSLALGGGSGVADMRPFQQDVIYRPFYFRSAGLPPQAHLDMNTMESRIPMQRVVPADPYQGNDVSESTDYGYGSGDYYV